MTCFYCKAQSVGRRAFNASRREAFIGIFPENFPSNDWGALTSSGGSSILSNEEFPFFPLENLQEFLRSPPTYPALPVICSPYHNR